jgi:hypothetical protein
VGREAIIELERRYPEPWGVLTVHRVLGGESPPETRAESATTQAARAAWEMSLRGSDVFHADGRPLPTWPDTPARRLM